MLFNQPESNKTSLKHLNSIRYWHRPGGGIVEIIEAMKLKEVKDPALLGKEYVELYAGSLVGMALQKSEKQKFWIAKTKEDPPDMVFMTPVEKVKGKFYFYSREVEIIRWKPEYGDFEKQVLKKDRRAYPKDYILVCFIETTGLSTPFPELAQSLRKKIVNLKHIFLVFNGIMLTKEIINLPVEEIRSSASLVQLLPRYDFITFNMLERMRDFKEDTEKLIYVKNGQVYFGIREGDSYPKIINFS